MGLLLGLSVQAVLSMAGILAGFALVLLACSALARARRARPAVVLFAGAAPGLLLLGTVFYANPLVEACEGHRSLQEGVCQASVSANPLLTISMRVAEEDLLHRTSLYATSAVASHWFTYPPAWRVALGFACAAALLFGLARVLARPEV